MEPNVERALGDFVDATRTALGSDLAAIVLFGSAVEDRLRPTSDVNLIVLLRAFDRQRIDALREPLRTAYAAARIRGMFLLERELPDAVQSFTVKFDDIKRRHRVLYGDDPLARIEIPRGPAIARLRQEILNQIIRLRGRYVSCSLREEQAALAVANASGSIRVLAAELLALEGSPAASPKEALQQVAGDPLEFISQARETGRLAPGKAEDALHTLIEVAARLQERAAKLS